MDSRYPLEDAVKYVMCLCEKCHGGMLFSEDSFNLLKNNNNKPILCINCIEEESNE